MNINQKNKKKKNVDLTLLDKKELKKKDEKIIEKNLELLKNDNLFVIDTKPAEANKQRLLNNKKKRDKVSKVEERIIKRMKKAEEFQTEQAEEKVIKDIWNDNEPVAKKGFANTKPTSLKYPKVPLPHPGQSYNPSKEDLSNLLHKVVELNKRPEAKQEKVDIEKRVFLSDDEDEIENLTEFKVSNNPPIDETDRKTKTERNRKIKAKLNRIKNEEDRRKKVNRINLSRTKSLKRINKEQGKAKEQENRKKLEELRLKKEKEELIKIGVIQEYNIFYLVKNYWKTFRLERHHYLLGR
jgi:hypothetical protein